MTLTPIELRGRRALLLPLELSHSDALWEASRDPEIWRYLPAQPQTRDDMARLVQAALEAQEAGQEVPFTVYDQTLGKVVGSTRFLDITPAHRNLEIGWTWFSSEVWRTRVNTECKYLLLTHCFETLNLVRVCLKTDGRNTRSQTAIERLGATKDGVLRHHRIMPDGYLRDSVYYSILADEWPEVKRRLESFWELHAER